MCWFKAGRCKVLLEVKSVPIECMQGMTNGALHARKDEKNAVGGAAVAVWMEDHKETIIPERGVCVASSSYPHMVPRGPGAR